MAVTLALATGIGLGSVYSWVHKLYKYNREAFMNDLQTQQESCYQEDNLKVTMSSMDREEVRDLTEAGISRINYAILVTTVLLALAGELLFEGQIPRDCADFVLNAYMLCLVSTIFHLFLAIIFGLMASFEAQEASALVLTKRIRPQWQLHFSRMMFGSREEETRAFEEQDLGKVLRLPLYDRFLAREGSLGPDEVQDPEDYYSLQSGSPPESPRSLTTAASRRAWGRLGSFETPARAPESPTSLRSQPSGSFACDLWSTHEAEWSHLSRCMFKCAAFGATSLLEACHYLSLGMLYSAYSDFAWVFWMVHIVFTSLLILIFQFLMAHWDIDLCRASCPGAMSGSPGHTAFAILLTLGPITGGIAAATDYSPFDNVGVPLSYLSHALVNLLFTLLFEREEREAPKDVRIEGGGDARLGHDWARQRRQATRLGMLGMWLICGLWFFLMVWARGYIRFLGPVEYKNSEAAVHFGPRKPPELRLAPVDMESNSSFFTPRALVCPGQAHGPAREGLLVFMADEFKVYEFKKRTVSQYSRCNLTVPVADLAARCNDRGCWPIVLLNAGLLPIVFDCATNRREPLLQAHSPALRFANMEQDKSFLIVAHPHALTQYFWSERRQGWVPRWDIDTWTVDDARQKAVLAMDRYQDRLLLFHSSNEVVSRDLHTGKTCGRWSIPDGTHITGGGCTNGSIVSIFAAGQTKGATLMIAELPAAGFRPAEGGCEGEGPDVHLEGKPSLLPSGLQLPR